MCRLGAVRWRGGGGGGAAVEFCVQFPKFQSATKNQYKMSADNDRWHYPVVFVDNSFSFLAIHLPIPTKQRVLIKFYVLRVSSK